MLGVSFAIIVICAELQPSILRDIGLAGAIVGFVLFGYLVVVNFRAKKRS